VILELLRLVAVSLFSLLLCSCSVLQVQRGEEKLPGLPFYPKIGVCHHEVVWAAPVYTLNLKSVKVTVTADKEKEEVQDIGSIDVSRSTYANANPECPINQLKTDIATGENPIPEWTKLINKCAFDPLVQGLREGFTDKDKDIVLVSNTNTLQPQVDYRNVYYINAKHPFSGSAKVDAKLNADGSLSEGTGEVDDRTFEAVVSLLSAPFGGGASSTAATPAVHAAMAKAAGTGAPFTTYRLEVTPRALLYTLFRDGPIAPNDPANCQPKPKFAIDEATYNLRVSLVPTDASTKAAKNTVKISGEVKLPEKP